MVLSKIDGTTIHYKTVEVALKPLEFKALITIIIGANGVGKSTLLKYVAGRFGKRIIDQPFRYLKDIPTFPLDVTVKTFLSAFLTYDDYASLDRQNALIECLQFQPFLDHYCHHLSKGNQMKLNLIITLQADVPLYLLDEPFNGLDQASKTRLTDFFIQDQKQFIVVSHIDDVLNHPNLHMVSL